MYNMATDVVPTGHEKSRLTALAVSQAASWRPSAAAAYMKYP
jgi:hypothetical protein